MKRGPASGKASTLGALRLVREVSVPVSRDDASGGTQCRTPRDVVAFMQGYVDHEEAEVFWILALDVQARVLFDTPILITRGILNSSLVHPREVFRAAIVAGAAGIIPGAQSPQRRSDAVGG